MKTITKNWKTTVLGLIMIAAGLYTGITAKASWTESMVIMTAGLGFVFSKDHDKTGV